MAEDFDVEAMLEAPYKKGVSYVCNVGIKMAFNARLQMLVQTCIFAASVVNFFVMNSVLILHQAWFTKLGINWG